MGLGGHVRAAPVVEKGKSKMKPWYTNLVVLLWLNAVLLAAILIMLVITQRHTVTASGSGFFVWDNWDQTAQQCTYDGARIGYVCEDIRFLPKFR